jgi:hypothetical protein
VIFTRLLRGRRDLHAVFTSAHTLTADREVVGSVPMVRLLAVASVVLLVAGCSSGSSAPDPSAAPSNPAVSSTPSAPASAAPCPDGAYLLSTFEGRGDASAAGKGSGGNITADFTSGKFTISSDGTQPAKLDFGPVNAEMRFNGEITGTYEGDPTALRLTTQGAHGDVAIKGFGISRNYSVGGLANQLIGQGATAQVTCDDAAGTAVVVLPNASLTLTRSAR